jgi:poly(3-hydroxybutyrate) depolymerase
MRSLLIAAPVLTGVLTACSGTTVPAMDRGPETQHDLRLQDVGQDPPDATLPDVGCTSCTDADGCCGAGCTYRDDDDCPICDPSIGIPVPMPTCSATDPCTNLLPTYGGVKQINTAVAAAVCKTTSVGRAQGRAVHDDGAPRSWTDVDGNARTWCEFRPAGTSESSTRPLVIYIHGSGGASSTVYDVTNLRTKAETYDLSGDPGRKGFILVATQGRYLHWPTSDPQDGTKHDTYHRDLTQISTNRDIALVDHIVDTLISEGVVDPHRVYLMGWSNGGRFSTLYGIARHQTQSPGGHNVAAVANYSNGDPMENITPHQTPSCRLATYPTTTLPVFLVSRSCDVVTCDAAQDQALRAAGMKATPGNVAETWITTLKSTMQDPDVTWVRINTSGLVVSQCVIPALCTKTLAALNHLRWPDGVNDKSGNDHEPAMLDFLAQHTLP